MSEGRETFEAEHDELYSSDLVGHFSGMPPIDIAMHRMFGPATFSPVELACRRRAPRR